MVIPDLKRPCAACKGTGFRAGIQRLGITDITPDARCVTCAGRGFVLTPLGEDLVQMLRPFVQDIVEERLRRQPPATSARPT